MLRNKLQVPIMSDSPTFFRATAPIMEHYSFEVGLGLRQRLRRSGRHGSICACCAANRIGEVDLLAAEFGLHPMRPDLDRVGISNSFECHIQCFRHGGAGAAEPIERSCRNGVAAIASTFAYNPTPECRTSTCRLAR
ncbi:hypothetical protein GNX14_24410 [Mesorhizobium japonicum]|nr:hypothetical protein [Mesorhizobium japonicum]